MHQARRRAVSGAAQIPAAAWPALRRLADLIDAGQPADAVLGPSAPEHADVAEAGRPLWACLRVFARSEADAGAVAARVVGAVLIG